MVELHKNLYDVAVKLSIYSSALDFGLAMSTVLLGNGVLPGKSNSMLLLGFDDAITYVTFAIMGLFGLALFLKHKSRIVNISIKDAILYKKRRLDLSKMNVSVIPRERVEEPKVVFKTPEPIRQSIAKHEEQSLMNVKNSKNESFLKINGVWYKTGSSRFERVSEPDYD